MAGLGFEFVISMRKASRVGFGFSLDPFNIHAFCIRRIDIHRDVAGAFIRIGPLQTGKFLTQPIEVVGVEFSSSSLVCICPVMNATVKDSPQTVSTRSSTARCLSGAARAGFPVPHADPEETGKP